MDARPILSKISGLSVGQIDDIWAEVKTNSARLNACPRHLFPAGLFKLGDKIVCAHCGGTTSLTDAGWYVKGYVAAGGDPEDVWPGWKDKRSDG